MLTIGEKTIAKTVQMLERHLRDYKKDMNEAYLKAEGPLDVTLKAKYSAPQNGDGTKIDTSITFVAEKIKDSMKATVDEKQRELFDDKAPKVVPLHPPKVQAGYTKGQWRVMKSRNGLK